MRATRGLRAFLVAIVLAAVAAASMLEGSAADLVAGDDGDVLVTLPGKTPALFAVAARRPPEVFAARRIIPFLSPPESPALSRRTAPSRVEIASSTARLRQGASRPLPSRAPPAS